MLSLWCSSLKNESKCFKRVRRLVSVKVGYILGERYFSNGTTRER